MCRVHVGTVDIRPQIRPEKDLEMRNDGPPNIHSSSTASKVVGLLLLVLVSVEMYFANTATGPNCNPMHRSTPPHHIVHGEVGRDKKAAPLPGGPPAPAATSTSSALPNKVTIVLMGYSMARFQNYREVFGTYAGLNPTHVQKVIFVWNNPDNDPPQFPSISSVPFQLVRPPQNSMLNRFRVSTIADAAAVLLVDDDVLLDPALIECMFLYWQREPTRMVGLDLRVASEAGKYGDGRNGPAKTCEANIIIGKTMLFSVKYLDVFLNDAKLVEKTEHSHCEDIAMNAVVLKATNQTPVWIRLDLNHNRMEGKGLAGRNMTDAGALSAGYIKTADSRGGVGDATRDPSNVHTSLGGTSNEWTEADRKAQREKQAIRHAAIRTGTTWFDERTACVKLMLDHFGSDVFDPRQHGVLAKGGGQQGSCAEMAECCPGPTLHAPPKPEFEQCTSKKGVAGWSCQGGGCMGDANGYNSCTKVRLHQSMVYSNSGKRCRPVACDCPKT
jgi:hypothetical protein